MVQKHFADALSADDFLARVEVALAAYGFRGDNSLALTNVCRDESTGIFKEKIDAIFGQCFNINGLGGVLTCGVTGTPLIALGVFLSCFFSVATSLCAAELPAQRSCRCTLLWHYMRATWHALLAWSD